MHELAVTQSVLQIALQHAGEGCRCRVTDLYLVVGQLSSMVDESVQFYWNIISEGTAAEGANLHFKRIPAEMQCRDCSQRYALGGDEFTCPTCGSASVRLVSGDEFYLEAIEIEPDLEVWVQA
jgi:hydrogenase nickel incorporation protein HypA/HybF